MADAFTTPADVFQSAAFFNWVRNYSYNNLALLGASPYVTERNEIEWSDAGDTITEFRFNGKVVAVDLKTDGTVPVSQKVTVDSRTLTVVGKYASLKIPRATMEDVTKKQNFNLIQAIARQVAEAFGDTVDKSLITTAETTTLTSSTLTGPITYDDIINARAKWGDKMGRPALCVVHSTPYVDALKNAEVRNAGVFGSSTLQSGELRVFGGLPIAVSDNISRAASGDKWNYTNLIIRANGLGYSFKRTLSYRSFPIEGDMDIHEFTMRYVTILDGDNELPGVVTMTSQMDS